MLHGGVLQIDLGLVALILALILIFAVVIRLRKLLKDYQEKEVFLNSFSVTPFNDFSAFDFKLGRFSHNSPFPRLVEGEWRYVIYLTKSEFEDTITINHELSECVVGRVIERVLNLNKPLYCQRSEDNRFWVKGKKQYYLIEHIMVTLGEINDLTPEKLRERLNKEEIESWT